ncbi:MAG: ribosomal RNA small subunit methyltransferase A [Actinobacteria bacterium RBG_19FT_COMBO_70_19]|nr:MAG: ribosomal RNA small subunit methyltransferase A [Actinobacteria bacterium RBG_19FT_COMBO_70_19]
MKDLARRHGVRPTKALGQHFLADPNLARAIVADAGVRAGDRVVEVGAGLGSLTVALAAAGARVIAVEFDRTLLPPLREIVAPWPAVRIEEADAMRLDWASALPGDGWKMVSNLPYNVAVPLVVDMLEEVPQIRSYLVMVQREVGERLAAAPGDEAYGAVSVRVRYRADAQVARRVPASVFWPRPKVDSVLVRLERRAEPPVATEPQRLFRVVDEGFAERRKTMRNALRRLGLSAAEAVDALERCGLEPNVRAERLSLEDFARLAETVA